MNARDYLVQALEDFKCTQDVLATLLGIPRSTLARWLHRRAIVPHQRITVLALASVYFQRGNVQRANELMSANVEEATKEISNINRDKAFNRLKGAVFP